MEAILRVTVETRDHKEISEFEKNLFRIKNLSNFFSMKEFCIAGSNLNPNMAIFEKNSDIAVIEMSLEHRYMKFSEIL